MTKRHKFIGVCIVLFFLVLSAASRGFAADQPTAKPSERPQGSPSLDPAVVHAARMAMRVDAISFALGKEVRFDWTAVGIELPSEDLSPDQIRQAFQNNEISAERRFSKPFIVRGELDSVVKGRDQLIDVRFVGGGLAANAGGARASVAKEYADIVADWNLKLPVTLRCDQAANVRSALRLENCVPKEAVFDAAEKAADRQVDRVFARESLEIDSRNPEMRKKGGTFRTEQEWKDFHLVATYAIGLMFRECQQDEPVAWNKCAGKVKERPKFHQEFASATVQAEHDLNITLPRGETTELEATELEASSEPVNEANKPVKSANAATDGREAEGGRPRPNHNRAHYLRGTQASLQILR
jgi:hypothetical protein